MADLAQQIITPMDYILKSEEKPASAYIKFEDVPV